MELTLRLRIVLEKPPGDVDFGLQLGKGKDYQTIEKRRSNGKDLSFDCKVRVRNNRKDGLPNFLGPITQGPPTDRFIYVDVGQYAGQSDCRWSRRIKVPLDGITWELMEKAAADQHSLLETRLKGTGKDGGPICGTVRPMRWSIVSEKIRAK